MNSQGRSAVYKRKDIVMAPDQSKVGRVSIEASRKALRRDLKKKCKGEPISKNIPFTNNDVPEYLRILANLEERSKRASIVVK